MSGAAGPSSVPHRVAPTPNGFERLLAYGAAGLLAAVAIALIRGNAEWARVPLLVWLHVATIAVGLALTPLLLLGRRGARRHRRLGYAWVAAMSATALLSFGIRGDPHGGLSPIHALSAVTLIQAPMLAWHAHRHRVSAHRTTALTLVGSALLIAGLFTFPFGRMLGRWLFG